MAGCGQEYFCTGGEYHAPMVCGSNSIMGGKILCEKCKEKKLKIAVYSMAKNEHTFVDRFMDSCEGADVVVVGVDPGDTTGDLLAARGATVIRVDLPKFRFDAYRNAVLNAIPNDVDICVSLDMDEVLPKNWRETILSEWKESTTRLHYHLQWSDDSNFVYDRIHARHGYIWRHVNHEAVYAIYPHTEHVVQSKLVVTHLPDWSKDRTKNLPLLQFAVEEEPDDVRMHWYLMREYHYEQEHRNCINQGQIYMNLRPPWDEERAWACIFIARSYRAIGFDMEAQAWLNWGIRTCRRFRDALFELALYHWDWGESQDALKLVEQALTYTDTQAFFESNGAYGEEIWMLKARLHADIGEHSKSQYCVKKVLRINPDHEEAIEMCE